MKFYQKRSVALVVLILAILGASVYGYVKKPTPLPKVEYQHWICDEANLLDGETEQTIKDYNTKWNNDYYAIVAVAAVDHLHGWKVEDFAAELGKKWGLGGNDMLLLLVEDSHYYVALGDNAAYEMTDTQQSKLKTAVEDPYYQGDFNAAAVAFFRQADIFYAQALSGQGNYVQQDHWAGSSDHSLTNIGVVLVLLFAVWAMLDQMRYRRYCRRAASGMFVHPYYPIFWGRSGYSTGRPRSYSHQRTYSGSQSYNRRPSSGFGNSGFGGGSRSTSSRSTSSRSSSSRSRSSGGSRGGGFGNSGFGGGHR